MKNVFKLTLGECALMTLGSTTINTWVLGLVTKQIFPYFMFLYPALGLYWLWYLYRWIGIQVYLFYILVSCSPHDMSMFNFFEMSVLGSSSPSKFSLLEKMSMLPIDSRS